MNLLPVETMFKIRDSIVAKTQDINFYGAMSNHLYNRYPHVWKYGEQVAKNDVEVKFDRETRQWKLHHKQGLFKSTSFEKKPSKTMIVFKTLWQISLEVSKGSKHFATI